MHRRIAPIGALLIATGTLAIASAPQAVLTSTYIGGSREVRATAVRALAPGMVAIGGTTASGYWPFARRSVGAYQGGDDAFWIQIATPSSR